MFKRLLQGALGCAILTAVLVAFADDAPKTPPGGAVIDKDKLTLEEQGLARRFGEFEQALLKLKQRYERSPKMEDRDRAVLLGKALERIRDVGVGVRFDQLVDFLRKDKLNNLGDIKKAMEDSRRLAEDLREILALLREDSRAAKLREERLSVEALIREIEAAIQKQKIVRALTEQNKTEQKELGNAQKKVTKQTGDILKKLGGEGGEAKDSKGEAKDQGKGDGKNGEAKDAGKSGEAKTGESKEGQKSGEAGKQGEAKSGKEGQSGEGSKSGKEGQASEAKSGAGKEGQGKEGQSKDGQAGDQGEAKKSGEKSGSGQEGQGKEGQAKGGQGKEGQSGDKKGQAGAAKSGGEKSGSGSEKSGQNSEAKSGGEKSGQGSQQSGSKSGQGKDGQAGQQGQAKAGDKSGQSGSEAGKQAGAKGSQGGEKSGGAKAGGEKSGQSGSKSGGEGSKAGEKSGSKAGGEAGKGGKGKSGEGSKGGSKSGSKSGGEGGQSGKQGEAKSGSQSQGQSGSKSSGQSGQSGQQGQQGQQGQAKNDPKQGGQQGGPKNQDPQETTNAKKRIKEAGYDQKSAEKNIAKGNNPDAGKDQNNAIQKLDDAKKKLEELLRQLREEELERLLAALQNRCEKMLAMQIRVYESTVALNKAIEARADRKADRNQQQDSLKLSDDEKEIVVEATKAIEILEAEGSAVAFPEVFQQVREDMKHVQRRLSTVDPGKVTIAIEEDIIATLKEMIEALKKAQQEVKQGQPKPGKPGPTPPPQDQKLLDQIAELKMIRSMQMRVNQRTKLYGQQYEGEQTGDPNLRRELRNLSERQDRIFEAARRIAKGDNR